MSQCFGEMMDRDEKENKKPAVKVRGKGNLVFIGCEVDSVSGGAIGTTAHPQRRKSRVWKDELIGLLVDRGAELELSVRDLQQLAAHHLGREVRDLSDLKPDELGGLYEKIHSLRRPALE